MNRPTDFTDELRAFADDEIEQAKKGNPYGLPPETFDDPHLREAWYVGLWLNVRLKRQGVPMPVIRKICFDNGKKLVSGCDPWEVTQARMPEIEVEAGLKC